MLIVALAGLPGSGKSTLARLLAPALDAPLFDKDRVRASLFAPAHVRYTSEQDDVVCRLIHDVVRAGAASGAYPAVVLDGRTYTRAAQVAELVDLARAIGARLEIVECACSEQTALARLARDARAGVHPAADRGPVLYARLRREREPIDVPHLVLDTDLLSPEQALAECLAYLGVA